ncbi:hypothetical protein BX283_6503 [Streptomyces sp. TLI_146]|nr:hypothetical protein BX283_6503 [Streptomyces sp. TLI_146]
MVAWVDPRYADLVEFFRQPHIGGSVHCPKCYGVRDCVFVLKWQRERQEAERKRLCSTRTDQDLVLARDGFKLHRGEAGGSQGPEKRRKPQINWGFRWCPKGGLELSTRTLRHQHFIALTCSTTRDTPQS